MKKIIIVQTIFIWFSFISFSFSQGLKSYYAQLTEDAKSEIMNSEINYSSNSIINATYLRYQNDVISAIEMYYRLLTSGQIRPHSKYESYISFAKLCFIQAKSIIVFAESHINNFPNKLSEVTSILNSKTYIDKSYEQLYFRIDGQKISYNKLKLRINELR